MAAYTDLYSLTENVLLFRRVCAAVAIACDSIRTEDPGTANHAERVAWAKRTITNVDGTARHFFWALLAQYADQDVTVIENATDAQIQAAVDNAVNLMASV